MQERLQKNSGPSRNKRFIWNTFTSFLSRADKKVESLFRLSKIGKCKEKIDITLLSGGKIFDDLLNIEPYDDLSWKTL